MPRHPFDAVSAVLGILAVTFGLLVMVGELGTRGSDAGWWIAIAAVVMGIALLPWRRPRRQSEATDERDGTPRAADDVAAT
jgi:type VI protein secretion system component VasK